MIDNLTSPNHEDEPFTYENFVKRLVFNREHYRFRDPKNRTLGSFAAALLIGLETKPFISDSVEQMQRVRKELTAAHAVKLTERAFGDVMRQVDPYYPQGYRNPVRYLRGFDEIGSSEDHVKRLYEHMYLRDVQSNIPERYKILKWLNVAYGDRFDGSPSVLDVGSSVLHGDLMLAYEGTSYAPDLRFKEVDIVNYLNEDERRDLIEGKRDALVNPVQSGIANTALKQTVSYGNMRGLDLTNIDSSAIREWVRSCSFYPDEMLDPAKVAEYDLLETLDPRHDRVKFSMLNIADSNDVRKIYSESAGQGFDIIFLSTVLYQTKSWKVRNMMFVHAIHLLSKRGVVVVQEALDGNFEKPYEYTAWVHDPEHPSMKSQEIMRWKTPRCTEGMFGPGTLSIDGKKVPLVEALSQNTSTL